MNKQQIQNIMATHGATIVPHVFSFLIDLPNKMARADLKLDDGDVSVTLLMFSPDDFLVEACLYYEPWWFRGSYHKTIEVLVQLGALPDDESLWEGVSPEVELTMGEHDWIKSDVKFIVHGDEENPC